MKAQVRARVGGPLPEQGVGGVQYFIIQYFKMAPLLQDCDGSRTVMGKELKTPSPSTFETADSCQRSN